MKDILSELPIIRLTGGVKVGIGDLSEDSSIMGQDDIHVCLFSFSVFGDDGNGEANEVGSVPTRESEGDDFAILRPRPRGAFLLYAELSDCALPKKVTALTRGLESLSRDNTY